MTLIHLAEKASVMINKDRSHVSKHGHSDTPFRQGRYSQSFLDAVSHHQGSFGIVCQTDLEQCKDINIRGHLSITSKTCLTV